MTFHRLVPRCSLQQRMAELKEVLEVKSVPISIQSTDQSAKQRRSTARKSVAPSRELADSSAVQCFPLHFPPVVLPCLPQPATNRSVIPNNLPESIRLIGQRLGLAEFNIQSKGPAMLLLLTDVKEFLKISRFLSKKCCFQKIAANLHTPTTHFIL
jgi:hypothetical protein